MHSAEGPTYFGRHEDLTVATAIFEATVAGRV